MVSAYCHLVRLSPYYGFQAQVTEMSADGGGVRGLSSLLVLQRLMYIVNQEREKNGDASARPCELFDLIGGTSTGGWVFRFRNSVSSLTIRSLIAIMLGRLGMDVQDCIDAYVLMSEVIFDEQPVSDERSNTIRNRYDGGKLKSAIEEILTRRHLPINECMLTDGDTNVTCRRYTIFVLPWLSHPNKC